MAEEATREARALSMLQEMTKELGAKDTSRGAARDLRDRLTGLIATLEPSRKDLHALLRETTGNLAKLKTTLQECCLAGLADFYVQSASALLEQPTRSMLEAALAGFEPHRDTIPQLFPSISRRIETSGYDYDLDDLRVPLNTAGEQLIALLLEDELWPVVVTATDEAPVVGLPPEATETSTLDRMREEAARIKRAGGIIEMREPHAAMVSMMDSFASWLPFRTFKNGGVGGGFGGGGGGSGDGGGRRGGGRGNGDDDGEGATSAPPERSGRKPNFRVITYDPECAVSCRWSFLGQFQAFGGPKTPVDNYLPRGFYYFKVYNAGNEYITRDKVKVPDNSPLTIPYPPRT